MILLVGDQLVVPGALLVDLLLVESSLPRYFALLAASSSVPLRDTHHGRDRRTTNSRPDND
jgi:hypothetical protein